MPSIDVNIEVYCAACGAGLCNQTESTWDKYKRAQCFRVRPCENCLELAAKEGRSAGYDSGYADGESK